MPNRTGPKFAEILPRLLRFTETLYFTRMVNNIIWVIQLKKGVLVPMTNKSP